MLKRPPVSYFAIKLLPLTLLLVAPVILIHGAAPACAEEELRYAAVEDVQGDPEYALAGVWQPLFPGRRLNEGSRIRTPAGAAVILLLIEGNRKIGQVKVRENSDLVLEKMFSDLGAGKQSTLLNVAVGSVLLYVGALERGSSFEVKTPVSTSGVRGTGFSVDYNPRRRSSETAVYEGEVDVRHIDPQTGESAAQAVTVPAGTRALVEAETGVMEPTPLSSEELAQTLQELDQLKIRSTGEPRTEIFRRRFSIPEKTEADSSKGALPRFGLFLLSAGLVFSGLISLRDAFRFRSVIRFLVASALIAGGVWLFQSNTLQWNEIPDLTKQAFTELKGRLP